MGNKRYEAQICMLKKSHILPGKRAHHAKKHGRMRDLGFLRQFQQVHFSSTIHYAKYFLTYGNITCFSIHGTIDAVSKCETIPSPPSLTLQGKACTFHLTILYVPYWTIRGPPNIPQHGREGTHDWRVHESCPPYTARKCNLIWRFTVSNIFRYNDRNIRGGVYRSILLNQAIRSPFSLHLGRQ